jgi:GxxExxY protein
MSDEQSARPCVVEKARGKVEFDPLSNRVIACALEVHSALGPGLLESAYEQCLAHELRSAGIPFELQQPMPVPYKGILLDCGYRLDFVLDGQLIIELKSVETLLPIHEAQLLTYLKLSKIRVGLLMNFNTVHLRDGIKRMVH